MGEVLGRLKNQRRTSIIPTTFARLPAEDCRGSNAGDASSTIRRTGSKIEGDALLKRPLDRRKKERSPQLGEIGELGCIVVRGTAAQGESWLLASKRGGYRWVEDEPASQH